MTIAQLEPRFVMVSLMKIGFEVVIATPIVIEWIYRQPPWVVQMRSNLNAQRLKMPAMENV